jgi:hypothetical protein
MRAGLAEALGATGGEGVMAKMVAQYTPQHRARRWRAWSDHTENLRTKSRRLAGPVRVREATPEERRRFGIK